VAQQEGEPCCGGCPELDLVMGPQHANRLGILLEQVGGCQQVGGHRRASILEDITTARRDSAGLRLVNVIFTAGNERAPICVVRRSGVRQQVANPETHPPGDRKPWPARRATANTLLGQND